MPVKRVLTSVLVMIMVALPTAMAPPAHAADTGGIATRTVVRTTTFHPVYGQRFVLSGQVQVVSTDATGKRTYTPFPKQQVTLQACATRCTTTTPTWTTLGHATSTDDSKALFRFPLTAYRTRIYRVLFDAGKYLGIVGSSAQAILISTHRHVSVKLAQPRPGHFTMSGRVSPLYGGQRAALLAKTCASCAWRVMASQTTSRRGYYDFRFGAPHRTTTYIVRANASRQLALSYSRYGRVLVR